MRVKTAAGHYNYCIISGSGQSSYSSISMLMKMTTGNWQAHLTALKKKIQAVIIQLCSHSTSNADCESVLGHVVLDARQLINFCVFINSFISVSFIAPERSALTERALDNSITVCVGIHHDASMSVIVFVKLSMDSKE